ncbi:MAG: hypothetical protein ACTSQQ_17680 [Candidatus Helarchaeota archaeon]
MPVLIVTGNMAYDIVKEYIQPYESDAVAVKLPISIAAFITPDLVINHLKKMDLTTYSSIIVPGLMQGSAERIENALNWSDPQIMFNHQEKFFTMNVFERMGDVLFGFRFYQKIWELFSIPAAQIILWPLLIGVGFLMALAIRSTVAEKKNVSVLLSAQGIQSDLGGKLFSKKY